MSYNNYAEFLEDHEDEIVVIALKNYYNLCNKPDKIDNSDDILEPDTELLSAIDRVLQDFMPYSDYLKWKKERD